MDSQKIYIVTMYRFGYKENHSYVLGVYSSKKKAIRAGKREKDYRGGNKYYPECLLMEIDRSKNHDVILNLPEHSTEEVVKYLRNKLNKGN